MLEKVYPYRFQIFLITLMGILFGGLLFPENIYENTLSPIIFLSNLSAGIILISKRKKLMIFLIILLIIAALDFGVTDVARTGGVPGLAPGKHKHHAG